MGNNWSYPINNNYLHQCLVAVHQQTPSWRIARSSPPESRASPGDHTPAQTGSSPASPHPTLQTQRMTSLHKTNRNILVLGSRDVKSYCCVHVLLWNVVTKIAWRTNASILIIIVILYKKVLKILKSFLSVRMYKGCIRLLVLLPTHLWVQKS